MTYFDSFAWYSLLFLLDFNSHWSCSTIDHFQFNNDAILTSVTINNQIIYPIVLICEQINWPFWVLNIFIFGIFFIFVWTCFFLNQTKVYCNYAVGTHLNIELSDFCVFMVDIWFIFRYCSNIMPATIQCLLKFFILFFLNKRQAVVYWQNKQLWKLRKLLRYHKRLQLLSNEIIARRK